MPGSSSISIHPSVDSGIKPGAKNFAFTGLISFIRNYRRKRVGRSRGSPRSSPRSSSPALTRPIRVWSALD
jgi:hypothetical protein